MIGEMLRILMGIQAADNEAARQRMVATRRYAEAQNRADYEAHVRNHSFDDGVIIEGTFTVVDEPKLLEGK